jgi:hypothetical protein
VDLVGRSGQKARSRLVGVGLKNVYIDLSGGGVGGGDSAQATVNIKLDNTVAIRENRADFFKAKPQLIYINCDLEAFNEVDTAIICGK